MSNNVSDILKQLDSLNESTSVAVFIPSLKKNVRFKNLNLRQQKELLKSSIDDNITKLAFTTKFYDIIKENAVDPIDVNSLYIFDRTAIALVLRANGLDSFYNADGFKINLQDLILQNQNIDTETYIKPLVFELENLTVTLEVPKLFTDRIINNATINKLKGLSDKDVKTLIGELFVYEIIKFVHSFNFKNEDGSVTTTVLTDLSIDDRVTVVEKLPSTIINRVLSFIREYRALENRFVTIGNTIIDVDSNFFSV
jgi:hypothetical protein